MMDLGPTNHHHVHGQCILQNTHAFGLHQQFLSQPQKLLAQYHSTSDIAILSAHSIPRLISLPAHEKGDVLPNITFDFC